MPSPTPWRVSAIVPSYNRGDLLEETLGSLMAQSLPPHEIIVVDDGSTDDTFAVVGRFGERVRYTRIENCGAPVARNVGAALATGDWLWFCDSDDLWRPEYLLRCRALAETPPHPQLLFGDFSLVRDGLWEPRGKFATAPAGFWASLARQAAPGGMIVTEPMVRAVLGFQPVFHSTLLMTRRFFEAVGGYDPRFARTGSEDFEFILRCMARPPFGVVDEPLVGIRRHAGNFSTNQRRALLGEVEILRHALAHHRSAARHADRIEAEITRRTLEALALAFSENDFAAARALARRLEPAAIDRVTGLKLWLAGLPEAVRAPAVAMARLPGAVRKVAG